MAQILTTGNRPLLCCYAGPLASGQNCQNIADSDYTKKVDGVTWAYCSQLHLVNHAINQKAR